MTILTLVILQRAVKVLWRVAAPALALICSACSSAPGPRTVSNPDPSIKIRAIKAADSEKDLSVIPQLIKDLDSDDPAVRFYAISGLERLTGHDFGYQYFVDEERRAPAVEKWRAWLEGWQAGQREQAERETQQR